MMRKSTVFVCLLLVAAVGVLWGTGTGEGATPAPAATLVQKSPVRVLFSDSANRGAAPDNEMVKKYIEEQSGVKFNVESIPAAAYTDKIQLIIASGEVFDLFSPGPEPWPTLKNKGVIQPLNDLLDKYAPAYKALLTNTGMEPPNAWPYVSDAEGKIWSFPNVGCIVRSVAISVRTDWLERLGMNLPKGAAGEPVMTFAQYEAYLDAVLKQDANGDGRKDDEFSLVPFRENLSYTFTVVQPLFTGFGGDRYLENRKVLPVQAHAGYKAMLAKWREWYSKGYLHPEFYVLKQAQVNDLVIADRVGSSMGWDSDHVRPMLALKEKNPNAYMTIIPPLKDPPAGGVSAYTPLGNYGATTYLSVTAENPEFAVKIYDWCAQSLDNNTTIWKGIQGTHWKWVDKAKLTIERLGDSTRYTSLFTCFVNMYPCSFWVFEVGPVDAVKHEYNLNENVKHPTYSHVRPFDAGVVYVTKGTPAEFLTGDAKTKLLEAVVKVIIGQMTLNDWDQALAEYMRAEGNILSEVWTKQYFEQRK